MMVDTILSGRAVIEAHEVRNALDQFVEAVAILSAASPFEVQHQLREYMVSNTEPDVLDIVHKLNRHFLNCPVSEQSDS